MREPVTLWAIVPRSPPSGVRRALVSGVGEQLGEQNGEHEVSRRVGVGAAAGRGPQGEEQKRAEVARGCGGFRQPRVAPGT